MAQRLFLHLVCRTGKHVWKSGITSESVKRILMSWPNHNAGITNCPHYHELRVEQFQRTRKWIPMTHAVFIDPQRHAIKQWIAKTGMPAIHVSKHYPPNRNNSFPYTFIGRVNVSSLYNQALPNYDPTIKPPLVVPVYGIRSLHFLQHVLDDLTPRLRDAITESKDLRDEDTLIDVEKLDILKLKADKL